jgi:hypothetical protein
MLEPAARQKQAIFGNIFGLSITFLAHQTTIHGQRSNLHSQCPPAQRHRAWLIKIRQNAVYKIPA